LAVACFPPEEQLVSVGDAVQLDLQQPKTFFSWCQMCCSSEDSFRCACALDLTIGR
jgi:hypothetical protein